MKQIAFLFMFSWTYVLAQNADLPKKHVLGLKLNSYIEVNNQVGAEAHLYAARPALELMKADGKGPLHMFELSGLSIRISDTELAENQFAELSFRYEIQLPIGNPLGKNAQTFSIGLGLFNTLLYQNNTPEISSVFQTYVKGYFADLYVAPKLRNNLNDRFFLDLSLLINFANFSVNESYLGDPSIPIRQQTTQTVEFAISDYLVLGFRLGFGFKL